MSKFLSEYDLKFIDQEHLENQHLTLLDFAKKPPTTFEIPYSVLEDDLPKIRARYYSIANDPFIDKESNSL